MSDDNQNKTQYESYYGYFPYKSYDEIQLEKLRRRRIKNGCLLAVLIFSALTALIILLSVLGGKLLFSKPKLPGDTDPDDVQQSEVVPNGQDTENTEQGGLVISTPEENSNIVLVKDVSDVVEAAGDWVVGIAAESYNEFTSSSSGSGIILTSDGYIVTNNHVIADSDSISVLTNDGRSYPAYVIGSDEFTDIAVIKIDATGLKSAELGDSKELRVGEAAIAIGNPTGALYGTVTAGIISGVDRNILVQNTYMNLIQTDASINPGNSGGALINEHGQVVGITSVKLKSSGYEGLGFAIPMDTVKPVVEALIKDGYVSGRPLVGVSGQSISAMAGAFYSLPQGVLVNDVEQSSDAYAKGIWTGDVVVAINDVRIYDIEDATVERNKYRAGDTVKLSVYRKGKTYEVEIELIESASFGEAYNL